MSCSYSFHNSNKYKVHPSKWMLWLFFELSHLSKNVWITCPESPLVCYFFQFLDVLPVCRTITGNRKMSRIIVQPASQRVSKEYFPAKGISKYFPKASLWVKPSVHTLVGYLHNVVECQLWPYLSYSTCCCSDSEVKYWIWRAILTSYYNCIQVGLL